MSRAIEPAALVAALMGMAGAVAVLAAGLSPSARLVPAGVAAVTIGLLAVELVATFRSPRAAPAEQAAGGPLARDRSEAAMLAWLPVLLGIVLLAGMPLGLPLYVLLYLRTRGRQRWRTAAGVALALWFVLSWGLQTMLGVRLYGGWVAERMGGA